MITAIATVVSSFISGVVAIIVCTIQSNKNMVLVQYRLEQLEKKVDKHNNLVERITVVESELKLIKALDHMEAVNG